METTYDEPRAELVPEPAAADGFANPAPFGLLAYGMSTVLLSLANAGVYTAGTMVLAMAVFFGGLAQVLVALMAFRNDDTFGVTAFGGYGFLWITLGFLTIGASHGWADVNSGTAMGYYLTVWAVFTLGLLVASAVAPRVLTGVLALTVVLLSLLAVANFTEDASIAELGGWEGVVTGAAAIYLAFAFLLNGMFGRTVLPVGEPLVRGA